MKIPTSHKPKLPKELSFPIGTELINDVLKEIELVEAFSIFYNHEIGGRMGLFRPGYALVKMKGESKELLPFKRVLSVNYSHPLKEWTLTVYPISKSHLSTAKKLVNEIGMKLIHGWLTTPKAQTWYSGRRYFIIGLNDELTNYCIWETLNDRTIKKEIKTTHNIL